MNRFKVEILLWLSVILIGVLLIIFPIHAKEWGKEQGKYVSAQEADWYNGLMMPDQPAMRCCGAGDAYYADDSEEVDGTLYAIITDTRDDIIKLDDGSTVARTHFPVGTRIPIPKAKMRKRGSENPTDHTVVFAGGSAEAPYAYCYEPAAGN